MRIVRWCGVVAWLGAALAGCDDKPKPVGAPSATASTPTPSATVSAAGPRTDRDDELFTTISTLRKEAEFPQPGRYEKTLEHGGVARRYLVQIPPNYDPERKAPLFFMLHGTGSPETYADRASGIALGAAQAGYVGVFPEGSVKAADGKGASWDHGMCAPRGEHDEVAFFRALIDELLKSLSVDERRIYVMGFSSGGHMTQRLGAELGDRLAAIVPVMGVASCQRKGSERVAIAPQQPMSALMVFGQKDPGFPVDGGPSATDPELTVASVADTTKLWTAVADCDAEPEKKGRPDDPVSTVRYLCPKTGREVIAIVVNGVGHELPKVIGNMPSMTLITRFLDGQTHK